MYQKGWRSDGRLWLDHNFGGLTLDWMWYDGVVAVGKESLLGLLVSLNLRQ